MLSLILNSCLDEVNLDIPESDLDRIAIRGRLIYGDPSMLEVSVAQVGDFAKFSSPTPVSSAIVRLLDEKGNILNTTSNQPGLYTAEISKDHPDIEITVGEAYSIEVLMPDGRMIVSAPETLWPVHKIDMVQNRIVEKDIINELGLIEAKKFGEILINTSLERPNQLGRSYLKWEFEGVYRFHESDISDIIRFTKPLICYFTDPIGLEEVHVFDGSESTQDQLSEFLILEEILDHRFTLGFYLTVYQQSLSQEAFEYWSKIGELIVRDGSFLESFPAKIEGNLMNVEDEDDEIFGFFYATVQDTARLFVSSKEAGFPIRLCPSSVPNIEFQNLDEVCKNCLNRERSTLQKPEYWID